jgi:heparosan-N-sulfate-glucuronate 5-epimerase
MPLPGRITYWWRIFSAYVLRRRSHLTFWHGTPEMNLASSMDVLGPYYMTFLAKANYQGPFDDAGVPQLNYRGRIGLQYNPIAIAQWGLGNYNLFAQTGNRLAKDKFLVAASWMAEHTEPHPAGTRVWNHHFDWEYRDVLKAPWYSGLSQGHGLSLLVRAHAETGDETYLEAADAGFETFRHGLDDGGVTLLDDQGGAWFEEAILSPPTHILNGFMWACWGVYDYALHTGLEAPSELWRRSLIALRRDLDSFDTGYWSLYDLSGKRMDMLASPFYHALHIVQLRVMHNLTGDQYYGDRADRWQSYTASAWNRRRAFAHKAIFKLLYY